MKQIEVEMAVFLRNRRIQLEISQEQVAFYLGLSVPQISRMERGVRGLDIDRAFKWMRFLGLEPCIYAYEQTKDGTLRPCAAWSGVPMVRNDAL